MFRCADFRSEFVRRRFFEDFIANLISSFGRVRKFGKQCKHKITTIVTGRKIAHWPTLFRLKRPTSLQLLGERIRQARKIKGLSQEDLALASNLAPSYIGGVERGQRNPSFKVLCAISKIIGRDVGSLCRNLPLPDELY